MADQNNNSDRLLISYMTLRKSLGVLGVALPVVLTVGNRFIGNCHTFLDSISHYYYSVMGGVFVGMLCAMSLFLLTYKGYDNRDRTANRIAGLCALGVAFFPTINPVLSPEYCNCAVIKLEDLAWRNYIHLGSAVTFFLTLSYISAFLFTESKGTKTPQKIIRNRIYRVCAGTMVGSILIIALTFMIPSLREALHPIRPVFTFEFTALIAFGTSWLVKGEVILAD